MIRLLIKYVQIFTKGISVSLYPPFDIVEITSIMEGTTVEGVSELIQRIQISDQDCSQNKIYFRQWVMWLNFVLVQLLLGMAHGYSAISLQQMKAPISNKTNDLKFENGEIFGKPQLIIDSIDSQSWIASSMLLFMTPGCWILAASSNKLGRKPILLISVAGSTVSWMIIAFADNVDQIVIGRSLSGICIGIITGLNYMYLGECAIPQLRTIFYALFTFSYATGVELCHFIGTWYHWRTTALFSAGLGIIALFSNYHLPESPIWLVQKNRFKSALGSWLFLKGNKDFNEFELACLKTRRVFNSSEINQSWVVKFDSVSFWKPLGIIIVIFTTSQMSGVSAVNFYCTPIIAEIAGPKNAYIATLIMDTIRLGGSIILFFSVKFFSTRTLIIFSGILCSLFLFFLALSIHFHIWYPWLQMICLFGYELSIMIGLGPLPWTFCSELFSMNHKEVGVSIGTNYYCILSFLIVKVNPYLFVIFEPWRTFLIYASVALTGTTIFYFILPNTKNKSLKEIELLFSSNSKS